jgi:hypothetical protein
MTLAKELLKRVAHGHSQYFDLCGNFWKMKPAPAWSLVKTDAPDFSANLLTDVAERFDPDCFSLAFTSRVL